MSHPPSLVDYLRISYRLAALLRAQRPDVLITHTHHSNILGQCIGALCGVKKRIAVNHSPDTVYSGHVRAADRIVGSLGIYTKIVAVSDTVGESLIKYPSAYREKITVINNGVSVLPGLVDKSAIKAQFGIPSESPMLVNVGRLSPVKNQALLLHALKYLPEAHLVIAGDGELRGALASLAQSLQVENRLHLAGELPSAEVNAIVARCDVFLFPSVAEAMGLALAEAMLLSRPIVASDIPVFSRLLHDGGILVQADDAKAWATAIERILSDPDLANALGIAANRIVSQYTPEKMASEYLVLMSA